MQADLFDASPAGHGGAKGDKSRAAGRGVRTRATRAQRAVLARNRLSGKFQFMREQTYAMSATKVGGTGGQGAYLRASIKDVLLEAGRLEPEGYRHLTAQGLEPQPPRALYGLKPSDYMEWLELHEDLCSEHTQVRQLKSGPSTRARPRSVPTVLGVVCSYPGPADDGDRDYQLWVDLVRSWALRHYGEDNVVSIVEHVDESHGHIHILVARPDADRILPLSAGPNAYAEAKRAGLNRGQCEAASEAANSRLGDEYFEVVSRHVDHLRKSSAPTARYSYTEAKIRKQMEQEIAVAEAKLDERETGMSAMEIAMKRAIAAKTAQVDADAAQRRAELKEVQDARAKAAQTQADLDELREQTLRRQEEYQAKLEGISAWMREQVRIGALTRAEAVAIVGGLDQTLKSNGG